MYVHMGPSRLRLPRTLLNLKYTLPHTHGAPPRQHDRQDVVVFGCESGDRWRPATIASSRLNSSAPPARSCRPWSASNNPTKKHTSIKHWPTETQQRSQQHLRCHRVVAGSGRCCCCCTVVTLAAAARPDGAARTQHMKLAKRPAGRQSGQQRKKATTPNQSA